MGKSGENVFGAGNTDSRKYNTVFFYIVNKYHSPVCVSDHRILNARIQTEYHILISDQ